MNWITLPSTVTTSADVDMTYAIEPTAFLRHPPPINVGDPGIKNQLQAGVSVVGGEAEKVNVLWPSFLQSTWGFLVLFGF